MLGLFIAAMVRFKLPEKAAVVIFPYYAFVTIHCIVSFLSGEGDYGIVSMLSSVRGLILLPTFLIIGYSVKDKQVFIKSIKKYYKFLLVVAIFGILEYIAAVTIGTKSFWMDFLKLSDYHERIKGQTDLIYNGVPWNWHTNGSTGNHDQRRLISFYGAPLTAGFVLLMPAFFYSMNFFKTRRLIIRTISRKYMKDLTATLCCAVALYLTYTRQTIIPFFCLVLLSFIYYNKKNRKVLIIGCVILFLPIVSISFSTFWKYFYNGSTIVHLNQIQTALQHISFWGKGIGTFGTRFAGSIGTESQYITILGQLGVIPLILYLVVFAMPILCCRRNSKMLDKNDKTLLCSICFSGIVYGVAGMVSETVAAFTSIAQYYILIGFMWGYCADKKGR